MALKQREKDENNAEIRLKQRQASSIQIVESCDTINTEDQPNGGENQVRTRNAEGGSKEGEEQLMINSEDNSGPPSSDLNMDKEDEVKSKDDLWQELEQKREANLQRKDSMLKDENKDKEFMEVSSKMYRCAEYEKYKDIVDKFEKKQAKIERKRKIIEGRKQQLEQEDQIQYKI